MRKLIRLPEVMRIVKYNANTINRMLHKGIFPPPIKLTSLKKAALWRDNRAVAWLKSEVLEWIRTHERKIDLLPELIKNWNQSRSESLLLENDLTKGLDLSYSIIAQMIRHGEFPKPVAMPKSIKNPSTGNPYQQRSVWLESDIESWIDERIAERDKD